MNTLALNFDYIAQPWINFDFHLGLNLYHAKTALQFFRSLLNKQIKNITKSHHSFPFFADFVEFLSDNLQLFYIYRDPRDVMLSYWEIIQKLPWDEGPKSMSVSEFMRSAPQGAMLRYQKEQMPTVLHRWKSHVEGWVGFGEQIDSKIILIRYEDLNLDFDDTVRKIGEKIGQMTALPKKPGIEENVVAVGKGEVGRHREYLLPEDYEFISDTIGTTMARLGYQ